MLRDAVAHTKQVWNHVLHGKSTLSEKLEFGAEVAASAAAAYALHRFVPVKFTTAEKILPKFDLFHNEQSVAHDFVQKDFVCIELKAKIPPGAAEFNEEMPTSRLGSGKLPQGNFFPNETEWRELMSSRQFERDYSRKVLRGESPNLSDAAPPRVKALNEIAKGANQVKDGNGSTVWMTARGLEGYKERLNIPDSEIDTVGKVVLDFGAGAQQELAKDARKLGLRSTFASVDPGLSQPLADDLARTSDQVGKFRPAADSGFLTPKEYRYLGRLHPERFTTAHESDLPFKQFDSVYAQYSLPFYSKADEINEAMERINNLVKPGGNARVYPIRPSQIDPIKEWFASRNMQPNFELKPEKVTQRRLFEDSGVADFHLLTWTKPEA